MKVSEGFWLPTEVMQAPSRDKHVFASMQLVPAVEQRGLRIVPHTHSAHLVNIQTRRLLAVNGLNVAAA